MHHNGFTETYNLTDIHQHNDAEKVLFYLVDEVYRVHPYEISCNKLTDVACLYFFKKLSKLLDVFLE